MLPNYNQTKPIHLQIQEKFRDAILQMIYLNHCNRTIYSNFAHQQGILAYLQEFGTVTVDIGRQTGKTSFIFENATENDIVVGKNMAIIKEMNYANSKPYYTTYDNYRENLSLLPMKAFKHIYLDMFLFSYLADKNTYCEFLSFLVKQNLVDKDSTIVRLG